MEQYEGEDTNYPHFGGDTEMLLDGPSLKDNFTSRRWTNRIPFFQENSAQNENAHSLHHLTSVCLKPKTQSMAKEIAN